MAGCRTKHDNPYCSVELPKIRVDVGHERERIERIKAATVKSWTTQIQDSHDRLRAVDIGCAVGTGKGSRSGRV